MTLLFLFDEYTQFRFGCTETTRRVPGCLGGRDAILLGARGEISRLLLLPFQQLLVAVEGLQQRLEVVGRGRASVDCDPDEVITLQPIIDGHRISEQRTQGATATTHHLLHGHLGELT